MERERCENKHSYRQQLTTAIQIVSETLWRENDYNTMNICIDENEEDEEEEEQLLNGSEDNETHATDVQYIHGDVTHPINTSGTDAIVVHCVGE